MKLTKFILLIVFLPLSGLCLALDSSIFDQPPTEKPPLPDGPLIKTLGDSEAWTVSYNYLDSATEPETNTVGPVTSEKAPDLNRVSKVYIERLKPYLVLQCYYSSAGKPIQYFYNEQIFFRMAANKRQAIRSDIPEPHPDHPPTPIESVFFAAEQKKLFGFDWISPRYYTGVQEMDGKLCMVFQKDDTKAWIDKKNRIPVIWKKGDEIRSFTYSAPITTTTMPEPILRLMKAYTKIQQSIRSQPMRGG
jgi:hypothetical protein